MGSPRDNNDSQDAKTGESGYRGIFTLKFNMAIFIFLGGSVFYRSSSALHCRSSTEILSRPLGYLLWGGGGGIPQCRIFVSGSSRIRTHVLDIAMQTCYRCASLTPQGFFRVPTDIFFHDFSMTRPFLKFP